MLHVKVPGMRLYVKPQTADLPLIDQKLAKKLALVDFDLAYSGLSRHARN
jgi:hypothetical protein